MLFISSHLDYCNALFSSLNHRNLSRLQLLQNAAARLLTRTKLYHHITPVLASLHWLPVYFRIDFKIMLLTYKPLNGLAPLYLTELLKPYETGRCLRSCFNELLAFPRTRYKTKGDRAFTVRAPKLWNSLPVDIRSSVCVSVFKGRLKTYLYRCTFNIL